MDAHQNSPCMIVLRDEYSIVWMKTSRGRVAFRVAPFASSPALIFLLICSTENA
jgi:hypothetical protein